MRILKLSTLTIAGLFTVSLGACDSGVATEPDEKNEAQADDAEAEADADADADDAKPISGPGDAARALVEKENNYCAFAVGECLSRGKKCNTSGGNGCEASFAECRDEHVAKHCELGKKVAAGMKSALTCWGDFGGCSKRAGNAGGSCLEDLKACMAKKVGCDGAGCGQGKKEGISWPSDEDTNWPVSQVVSVEEARASTRYRPGYYRDRYGRIWYLSRYGRWYLVSNGGGGGWPGGGGGGGGGGWPGGGGGGGGGG